MRDAELDAILSKEQEIVPSSGFVGAVMEAVQREAAEPAPIPFPWKRALPGMFVGVVAMVTLVVASILLFGRGTAYPPAIVFDERAAVADLWKLAWAGWIGAALLLSFLAVKFAMRVVAGRD